MTSLWLVTNSKSGSTEAEAIAALRQHFDKSGIPVLHQIDLSKENLPSPDHENMPDIIASLGGDGTANAVIEAYGDTAAALLILPGGTMNLLARRLHGDASCFDIINQMTRNQQTTRLPTVNGPDFHSLVGVIAGPTAHWGNVRESLREGDFSALIETIPAAIEETFAGARIAVADAEGSHAALFITPDAETLHVHSIRADNVGDLAQHGWAWINRDFLGGPTEDLLDAPELVLTQDQGPIALLVDGERRTSPSPLKLCHAMCPAQFITTFNG